MKVFITGGTGLLGSTLLRYAPAGVQLFANYHENTLLPDYGNCNFFHLDIRNKEKVVKIINELKPDCIIHTAAKSSPDFCQKHPVEAADINVSGTRNILDASRTTGSSVLFMSSNQVFSGNNPPYTEESMRDPVNVYGKTKVESENDIINGSYKAMVIRLMTMYGWGNPQGQKNTAMWVIESLKQKKPIKVVNDIYNNFLPVTNAARVIWEIIQKNIKVKLLQVAGGETADRFSFAVKVADTFRLDTSLISPVPKSYFQDEAPRPYNTIYDISLLRKILKVNQPALDEGLRKMESEQNSVKWKDNN